MPSAQSDRTIFEDLSFDVDRGQIVDLVGPSGSGKSSLLTAFALLNPHADGTFTLDGADSSSFSLQQWRRNVAYLPQKPMLMGDSVADTIRLPWTLAVRRADEASAPDDHAATGKKTSARRGRFSRLFRSEQSQAKLALPDQLIRNTLDAMGCEDIDLARAPHDLSGGQAARVSLARTLLTARPCCWPTRWMQASTTTTRTRSPRSWPARPPGAWPSCAYGTVRPTAEPHASSHCPQGGCHERQRLRDR